MNLLQQCSQFPVCGGAVFFALLLGYAFGWLTERALGRIKTK
jgi:hypothetical protein